MKAPGNAWRMHLMTGVLVAVCLLSGWTRQAAAVEAPIYYYPSGSIYDYRWKLLELALAHTKDTQGTFRLAPYAEEVTQNRGMRLLQFGGIDVIALGTNAEREKDLLPVKIDILRGIVGFRIFIIRAADQARIAKMDDQALRTQLVFGLNSQWADLPVLEANGFSVVTSAGYENLFGMLAAGRFDAFPRGLNEAQREVDARKKKFPQLTVEKTKAIFFPYPIYFWVNKNNAALAQRIERGLRLSLADGSFRKLFESYHAQEIAALKKEKRHILMVDSPILPPGTPQPDTSWWWPDAAVTQ